MRSLLITACLFITCAAAAQPTTAQLLRQKADAVVTAIRDRNFRVLAGLVHPERHLRFSPYGHMYRTDRIFHKCHVEEMGTDSNVYYWGDEDGTGDPIEMTVEQYFARYVYARDFVNAPQVAVNSLIGTGNSISNMATIYPGRAFVEYYFPGTSQYGGMDWRSLRIVFLKKDGEWFLVGILNDEWTT